MSMLVQDQQLTRRVGAVTLIIVALATLFVVFVAGRIEWGSPMRIRVTFASTGGLQEGAPFVVAGRAIGHIESIALVGEGIVATVKLDRDEASRVTRGGDIFVASRGMLSTRYLEIGPPPDPDGPKLADGDELRGKDPPSLDRVLQRTWTNLGIARRFIEDVRPEARLLADEIDKLQATLLTLAPEIMLRDDFSALFDEAKRTYAALGGDPGLDRIRSIVATTQSTIGEARASVAKVRAGAAMLSASLDVLRARMGGKGTEVLDKIDLAITRIESVSAKLEPLLASIDAIQQRIERGEGSLLKLARDPEFPEDAKELGKILKRQPWKIFDRPPQ